MRQPHGMLKQMYTTEERDAVEQLMYATCDTSVDIARCRHVTHEDVLLDIDIIQYDPAKKETNAR